MKRFLPFLIIVLVAIATIIAGLALYRINLSRPVDPKDLAASERPAVGARHIRGEPNAPVTLVEFGDFECPPCGKLASVFAQIEEGHAGQLRIIFRHFPLAIHKNALIAAQASEAADIQGKFWETYDLLYREQANWSSADDPPEMFRSYAGTLGLDIDRFSSDMESAEVKQRLEADQKRGLTLRITATPKIYINDVELPMPANLPKIRAAIDGALKTAPSS